MLYTQGKTQCTPAEVGYSEQRIEVLKNHFNALIEDGTLQCATYCLSRKGQVFAHGGIGYKTYDKDPNKPVSPTDIHYIASVTKTFAAVALMKLVEDGVTRLDIPVGEILPQFNTPPYNGVTLFQLLTHTSGMHTDDGCFDNKYQVNYWEMIDNAYKLYESEEKKGDFDWIAAALSTIGCGLRAAPNTEWGYCSFGFVIIGAVIEKLTGIHANKFIEDNICKPLGLNDTAFDLTSETAKRYMIQDKDAQKYVDETIAGTHKSDWIGDKLNMPDTGGGMISTVWDMVRYGNMVLHGGTFDGVRILGRKAVERMTEIAIQKPDYCWNPGGSVRSYGIGFDHRNGPQFTFSNSAFMHEGSGACALYIDPDEEMVAAWIVPYAKDGWFPTAMFNPVNIIWSGIV